MALYNFPQKESIWTPKIILKINKKTILFPKCAHPGTHCRKREEEARIKAPPYSVTERDRFGYPEGVRLPPFSSLLQPPPAATTPMKPRPKATDLSRVDCWSAENKDEEGWGSKAPCWRRRSKIGGQNSEANRRKKKEIVRWIYSGVAQKKNKQTKSLNKATIFWRVKL